MFMVYSLSKILNVNTELHKKCGMLYHIFVKSYHEASSHMHTLKQVPTSLVTRSYRMLQTLTDAIITIDIVM